MERTPTLSPPSVTGEETPLEQRCVNSWVPRKLEEPAGQADTDKGPGPAGSAAQTLLGPAHRPPSLCGEGLASPRSSLGLIGDASLHTVPSAQATLGGPLPPSPGSPTSEQPSQKHFL